MRISLLAATVLAFSSLTAVTRAVEIRGQYLEARTCDVYTGPCFANGEMGVAGKEALLAWKVEEGSWKGTSLAGLNVALVLKAEESLGDDGVFPMQAGHIKSVILVDEKASPEQEHALVNFVKDSAAHYTKDIQKIQRSPMSLKNDHLRDEGVFQAGGLAEIRTRSLCKSDCTCTNEMVFYKPLTDVSYATPAYSVKQSYSGDALNSRWTLNGSRSSFLAVFQK